ncbi:histone deacetylase family protein [Thermoleophilia bacterium SCSIO 60948]|nr:histone deacetylase family protein [Thermoleophilia bacterium SCSIO 60948]
MDIEIPVVWTQLSDRHRPGGEIYVGVHTPGSEVRERTRLIRDELERAGAKLVGAESQPPALLEQIHDPGLLDHLERGWRDWQASGLPDDPGQPRVTPYLFPHPELLAGEPLGVPSAAAARAGRFAYDTMTVIGEGTWEAARAGVDAAIVAAELAFGDSPRGAAYACVRPPGHHATRGGFGGSCYLNNSALAAARLREMTDARVAVIDVDAHHGNGTQAIFRADPEVLTGSVHVDPGAGWFPHYVGFARETGHGPGEGANRNLPLAPGTGDGRWLDAVGTLADWAVDGGARALVVALGVDAAAGDPESPLEVSSDGYRAAGERLGALGLPTAIVQEGGYDLSRLATLVRSFLEGFSSAR